jgi:hypothetical protein
MRSFNLVFSFFLPYPYWEKSKNKNFTKVLLAAIKSCPAGQTGWQALGIIRFRSPIKNRDRL